MADDNSPSKSPRYGSTVAVASMGNAMLAQYWGADTRVGASAPLSASNNGLQARLADGRAGDAQDWKDASYIKRTLFNQN